MHQDTNEPWRVTLVDTGADTHDRRALKRIATYVGRRDVHAHLRRRRRRRRHRRRSSTSTSSTASRDGHRRAAVGRFGALELDATRASTRFREKPHGDGDWINGGFFVLEPGSSTDRGRRRRVGAGAARVARGRRAARAFKHAGFWQPMDTLRDKQLLEEPLGLGQGALEGLVSVPSGATTLRWRVSRARRVFVTGHTGFKGAWLTLWLARAGAEVTGYALEPPTDPVAVRALRLERRSIDTTSATCATLSALAAAMREAQPEIVFHLAAQPLVRQSYAEPVETFATNVMGTVNLLEAVAAATTACAQSST